MVSCGEQAPAIDVDPEVGRGCFETRIAVLPSGTQYEGIERAVAGRVTIRVMTYSPRTFILGPDDTLYRLASAKFFRMVNDPEHPP